MLPNFDNAVATFLAIMPQTRSSGQWRHAPPATHPASGETL